MDEMLPPDTAEELNERGHDAVSVVGAGLAGADDGEVFDFAVAADRVIVTENFADFSDLLEARLGRDEPSVAVVFVRKSSLPEGGALASQLAERLHAWADANRDPYLGLHWP